MRTHTHIRIFTNLSAKAECNLRSIFQAEFNRLQFSFPSLRPVVI